MLVVNISEKQSVQISQIKAKQIIGHSGYSLFLRKPKTCLDLLLDPVNILPQWYNSLNASNELRSLQEWEEFTSFRVRMGLAKNVEYFHSDMAPLEKSQKLSVASSLYFVSPL